MNEPITIAFSANDNHAMLLGVALCSIFENKRGDYPINIFIMDGGISPKNKERMAMLEKRYGVTIQYIVPAKDLFANIKPRDRSLAAYYRTRIGYLIPKEYHRVLYLDCDVIVRGDIDELFNFDLHDKPIAAVPDFYDDELREYRRKIAGGMDDLYFNSGIMLIDLDCWRAENVEEKLSKFMQDHPDLLNFDDQDPLNAVFCRNYQPLPGKYNVMAGAPPRGDDGPNPLVIHFSGGAKPWYFLSALRYQPDWVHYANLTPWRDKKYRKIVDIYFAKKYHFYPVAWWFWTRYKAVKKALAS